MIYKSLMVFLLSTLASSCAFIDLQKELEKIAVTGTIHGRIIDKSNEESSLILIVYDKKKKIVKYKCLHDNADYYAFLLPAWEKYHLVLFEDNNHNLKYDQDEPAGYWTNPENRALPVSGKFIIDLVISNNTKIPYLYSTEIKNLDASYGDTFMIKTGEIADINNKRFSPEYGYKGLWTPLKFLDEDGVGIYFLEEYDPEKIPIIFIYGIGGFPQGWKTFFKKIDRSRYQPWFYYYPSGLRIGKTGKALNIIVHELHVKYNFKSMYIVAHSMGGLVASEFIKRNISKPQNNYIKLFLSISTPWGGDKDAEWAKYAPAVIPCWKDLSPDCEFIKKLSPDYLGSEIPYFLLFSYHGDRKPFRRNNDNVVYLSSQLKYDMQQRAEKIYGFDLNHTQILSDQGVIDTCNAIFEKYDKRK